MSHRTPSPAGRHGLALLTVAALAIGGLTAVGVPTAASAATTIGPTGCSAADPEAGQLIPIQQAKIPATGAWTPDATNWTDLSSTVASYDRIGYCLELERNGQKEWVWTSMRPWTQEARKLTLSNDADAIGQKDVFDLRVSSNVAGVAAQQGARGHVEIWPNAYWIPATGEVPGGSSDVYDADDTATSGFWGSFQVHAYANGTAKTVLAVNGWSLANNTIDIGIGQREAQHTDWTFAANAGQYTARTLTTYVRRSVVTLSSFPTDQQFIPRDSSGFATVPIAGRVNDAGVKYMVLKVTSGTKVTNYKQRVGANGTFSFSPKIKAELAESTFDLQTLRIGSGSSVSESVAGATGVVAGDVVVIQGQSNAEAYNYSGSAAAEASPFVRSYGSSSSDPSASAADRSWHNATSTQVMSAGSVGQWGLRMAHQISVQQQIPIAVFNGAHGGQPISFFQRNDASPTDISTNYGRMLQRLQAAGVADDVKAVLWYQGENDVDDAVTHVAGFTSLISDWRSDFGSSISGGAKYNIFQVRTSGCWNSETINLRNAQRLMRDTLQVNVLSTTAYDAHDGCHYAYEGGYKEMGDQAAAVLSRDLYGGPSAGVAAPDPTQLTWTDASRTKVRVALRDAAEQLSVEAGAAADFRVVDASVTVTDVTAPAPGVIELTLSGAAPQTTKISYVAHLGAGPAITTSRGVGLLAFGPLPIS